MNGKQTKRMRRAVRRELRNDWALMFNAACGQKLRLRLKMAWRMIRAKTY